MRALFFLIFFLCSSIARADLTTGLQAWFKLDEATGSLVDSSSQGRTLTIHGTTAVNGIIGNARSFNGTTSDYLEGGDWFYSDAMTICVRVNLTTVDANPRTMLLKRNSSAFTNGPVTEWQFLYSTTGFTWQSFTGSNVSILALTATTTPTTGKWFDVCAVQGGNGVRGDIYINGISEANATQSGVMNNTANLIQIGATSNGASNRMLPGKIDDVRIWNVAKTAADIREYHGQLNNGSLKTADF